MGGFQWSLSFPFRLPASPAEADRIASATVDWSWFVYTQYVTDLDYLCNSVMLFAALHQLGSHADRLMLYPDSFSVDDEVKNSKEAELLSIARDVYKVKLKPISVVHMSGHDSTWAESFTKLLAFNQTEYKRVLNLDSDSTVLQNMDELFLLPSAPVAMPRAYWNPQREKQLSSQLMLVEPSEERFQHIAEAIEHAGPNTYDMEIMNDLYYDSCIVLPHRPYDLLTGEFRSKDGNHSLYLGNNYEQWNPHTVVDEAKFVHFSDWPIPKPWITAEENVLSRERPSCMEENGEDCAERYIWEGFYQDFARRRQEICRMDLRPKKYRD